MNSMKDLPKVGVYFGKFIPPHRGHLNTILNAATTCQKLYVIVSDNKNITKQICLEAGINEIPLAKRIQWLSQELIDMPHIKVDALDETNIPLYPNGWDLWTKELQKIVGESINVFFCGETEYVEKLKEYFPNAEVNLFDSDRTYFNISATKIRSNPIKYWDYILGPARPFFAKKVLIAGTESCVDGETEFFNGVTWKKIRDYEKGDMVLQYNEDSTASLVTPERYIKSSCDKMFELQNSYGTWSEVYSEDHDLVYITSKGHLAKKQFKDVMTSHFSNKYGFQGKLINSFNYSGSLSIDEFKLRLIIAVSADGTKAKRKWRIRLKKEQKIERMRYLIQSAGLQLDERIYADEYHNFYVPEEYGLKVFPLNYMVLNKQCKDIFIDEIKYWDATIKTNNMFNYFTTIKQNKDVVQFILSSSGKRIHIYEDNRTGKPLTYKISVSSTKYTTIDVKDDTDRNKMIKEFIPSDGFKYCFTVPSHMLVLRRKNHIFITGNCGKTTLTKTLAKIYHTSWSEEVGRYYAERFLGGNENYFTDEDFARIAHQQVEQDYKALRNANRICFFDTDATATQYFSGLYMGHYNKIVESYIDPKKYDLVILLKPDVEWIDDGQRLNGDQEKRIKLHNTLKLMYESRGFNVLEIGGNYKERLQITLKEIKKLLKK